MKAEGPRRRRGQGTLEYVLIFAVLVVILLVVGYVFRKQVQNAAKEVSNKLEQWTKNPSGNPKKSSPPKPDATPPKGTDAKGEKGAKGGLQVQKPADVAPPEPEEPRFSWKNLGIARQMMLVAGAVGVTMGVFLFLRQAKR